MEIPDKLLDEIVEEIMAELEDSAEKEGRNVNFDDIEGSILLS